MGVNLYQNKCDFCILDFSKLHFIFLIQISSKTYINWLLDFVSAKAKFFLLEKSTKGNVS